MEKQENLCSVLRMRPNAVALVKGGNDYPYVYGRVYFYQLSDGVLVRTEIKGLPESRDTCKQNIFAFHIHEGKECSGTATDIFANAKGHYNPSDCPHPYHAGDMPPLFSVNGRAFSVFLTDRFTLSEILGRTIIIHLHPDDFMTQPSGNAGEKIACGIITSR